MEDERTPELTARQVAAAQDRSGERVAMVCDHPDCQPPARSASRGFGEGWVCPIHGRAIRQPNRAYFGVPT